MNSRTYRDMMANALSTVPAIITRMDHQATGHASNASEAVKKNVRPAKLIAYQMHNTIADAHISRVHLK